jgi:Flp pilus assembly pilin Flp
MTAADSRACGVGPSPSHRLPTAILADRRGATAVEFAVVAPVLIALLLGLFEFSLLLTADLTLESAVTEAARFGITGRSLGATTREEAIRAVLERRAGSLLDPGRLGLETLVYPDFASIGQPEPFVDTDGDGVHDPGEVYADLNGNGRWDADMGLAGLGGPDAVVLYRARYPWRFVTPLLRAFFPPDGTVELVATMAVRNEPFPAE